jgi:hypothetical protein
MYKKKGEPVSRIYNVLVAGGDGTNECGTRGRVVELWKQEEIKVKRC